MKPHPTAPFLAATCGVACAVMEDTIGGRYDVSYGECMTYPALELSGTVCVVWKQDGSAILTRVIPDLEFVRAAKVDSIKPR